MTKYKRQLKPEELMTQQMLVKVPLRPTPSASEAGGQTGRLLDRCLTRHFVRLTFGISRSLNSASQSLQRARIRVLAYAHRRGLISQSDAIDMFPFHDQPRERGQMINALIKERQRFLRRSSSR